jgi:hypothetical protein
MIEDTRCSPYRIVLREMAQTWIALAEQAGDEARKSTERGPRH